jgi:hypothetical protein
MNVRYKTILHGDKSPNQPDMVYGYEFLGVDQYCCEQMKTAIGDEAITFGDDIGPSLCFSYSYWGTEDRYYYAITYCPFCGQHIEYHEVEKTAFKKVVEVVETAKYEQISIQN